MKKPLLLLLFLLLPGCGEDSTACLTNIASDLGTLTSQEIAQYNSDGCCQYRGGVSTFVNCSGIIVCEDGSKSTCSR